MMAGVEERVAYLHGRVGEHGVMLNGLRDAVLSLEQRMDRRFEAVDRRFDAVDRRFSGIDARLDGLDTKMSSQFKWLVGIQVTAFVAIIGALLGLFTLFVH